MATRYVPLCIIFAILLRETAVWGRYASRDTFLGAPTRNGDPFVSQMGTFAEQHEQTSERETDSFEEDDDEVEKKKKKRIDSDENDDSRHEKEEGSIPEVTVQTLKEFQGGRGVGGGRQRSSKQARHDSAPAPYYQLFLDSPHRFNFLWTVNYDRGHVLIEVHAKVDAERWLAVGFSDYGEVQGADFCVLWWDEWEKAHFQDAWTDSNGILHLDKKQDCRLSRLQKEEGKVIFMYERDFDTCDDGVDYVIDSGTTHVLYASGDEILDELKGIDMKNVVHGFQRAQLLKAAIAPAKFPKDTKTFAVLNDKAQVPDEETTYWCRVIKLPTMKSKKHIVQFEAVIQPGHETLVHHMEVFHCEIEKDREAPSYDGPCMNSNKPPELDPCKKVIAAWAMGALPLTYPEEAGLPIGGPDYSPYVMLEIHYNNEEKRDDFVDSSGVRFFFTSQLRRYDAGVLEIGLEYTPKMAIPPEQDAFTLSGDCIVECTEAALPPEGIVLFAAQLHTHLTGKQVVARHFRGGKELTEVAKDVHYSPHFQEIRTLKKPVLVLPGDALIATCTYQTINKENITLGGFAISDEMCVSYIHYYPKSYLEVCKSSIDSDVLANYFRFLNEYENQPTSPKKSVPENYHSVDWTPLRSDMLHRLYDTTTLSMQCNKSSGDRFPGYWNNIPQTKIVWPLPQPPRQCNEEGDFAVGGEEPK